MTMSWGSQRDTRLGVALTESAPLAPPQMVSAVMAALSADSHHPVPCGRPWRARLRSASHRLLLSLAVLVPTAASVGVAHAASGALPGDALYAVRLAREQAALALAPTSTARGSLALGFAQARLDTMHTVVARHGPLPVAVALMDDAVAYNEQAMSAPVPWLRTAVAAQYRAAQRDCWRLTHDPSWTRTPGAVAAEHRMDRQLDTLRALARHGAP